MNLVTHILRKHIFKLILLLGFILMSGGCSATRQYQIHNQKQGLMILDNTEMRINKKYYSKHNKKTKRKTARKYKKR